MVKVNIKSQAKHSNLEMEHELPAGDGDETAVAEASAEAAAPESELQKLKPSATPCWTACSARKPNFRTPAAAP